MKIKYKPPDLLNIGYENIFSKIKKAEISNVLLQSFNKLIFIVNIDWKKQPDNEFVKQVIIVDDSVEFLLSKNKSVCIVSSELPQEISEIIMKISSGFNCFMEFPVIFEKNYITGNIVGNQININRFLSFIENLEIEFDIISKKKYIPKGHGILSSLTMQQFKCLEFAVQNGYFDQPKRTHSRMLARQLNINHSTFLEHVRKAEKKIFENLFRA